jgi:hypothetical protein
LIIRCDLARAHILQTFFFGRRKPAIHFAQTNCLHCSHLACSGARQLSHLTTVY